VLKRLQEKKETLYVLPNSAAQEHAERRYPHKPVKVVDSGISGRCGATVVYGIPVRATAFAQCMRIVDVAAFRAKSETVSPPRGLLMMISAVSSSRVSL